MLRLIFQNIEQSFGPSLSPASWLFYCGGLTLLAVVVVVPIWRVWMEYQIMRTGMERHWVMTCGRCGTRTIVSSRVCGQCEEDLGIPWIVRFWTISMGSREGTIPRQVRWGGHLLGSAAFLLLSIWVVAGIGALAPQGALHRLFLGLALVALAVFGWVGGRALRIGKHGILPRVGDAFMALGAIGAMAVALFLADAARPSQEIPLARFETFTNAVQVGPRVLQLSDGEIGFEYLQLNEEHFGYHRIVPLGFSGSDRLPVERSTLTRWLVSHLRAHAAGYTARGFTVRIRTERLRIEPGQSYEVVERAGQVLIRRVTNR
jgi:hypothetical protein